MKKANIYVNLNFYITRLIFLSGTTDAEQCLSDGGREMNR